MLLIRNKAEKEKEKEKVFPLGVKPLSSCIPLCGWGC